MIDAPGAQAKAPAVQLPVEEGRPKACCVTKLETAIAIRAASVTANSPVSSNAIRMVDMGAPITGAATAPMAIIA